MDPETVAYAIKELKEDVGEIKKDVKSLMLFMAVTKANERHTGKHEAIRVSAIVSLTISIIGIVVEFALKV